MAKGACREEEVEREFFFPSFSSFESIDRQTHHHSPEHPVLSPCLFLSLRLSVSPEKVKPNVQSKRVSVLGSPLTQSSTGADEEEAAIVFVDDLVAESRRRRVVFGAAKADDEGTAPRREMDGAEQEGAMQLGLQLATSIV